jgi:hypothetical protein
MHAAPDAQLETLVEEFDRDVAGAREQICTLCERDPRAFQDAAVRLLKTWYTSRGIQYVVSLLAASDLLLVALCNPALTRDGAISLARAAMETDAAMDVRLAKTVAEKAGAGLPAAAAARLMDVLDAVSHGNRIMPSLLRLLRQPDAQLRSKAVLMIGRASRNVKWVQNRLADADPRTRANAVEALWGIDTTEARELLRVAAADSNNRVAGNALFALHRMGDAWAEPELLKMATAESAAFRASAVWAMSETGDPCFLEAVAHRMGDADAMVRKRAFSALGRLKNAAARRRAAQA